MEGTWHRSISAISSLPDILARIVHLGATILVSAFRDMRSSYGVYELLSSNYKSIYILSSDVCDNISTKTVELGANGEELQLDV